MFRVHTSTTGIKITRDINRDILTLVLYRLRQKLLYRLRQKLIVQT